MFEHVSNEEMIAFIDGELLLDRAAEVDDHLGVCGLCVQRYRSLHATSVEIARVWSVSAIDADDMGAARDRLDETMRIDINRRWSRRVPVVLALTAALMFFVVRHESTLLHRSLIVERGALPVTSLTPGLAVAVSTDELCDAKAQRIPDISATLRTQVLRDYGMEDVPSTDYELDYLITPELGGLADRRNLWPEPYGLRAWNAHAKDVLENRLPRLVCRGEIDLATAQRELASNWIGAYKKYMAAEPAIQLHARVLDFVHTP
jgi:hypothetical protein